MRRVYLDHHAAAPVDSRVATAMQSAAAQVWANPSSSHAEGRASRALLERARDQIAAAIRAEPADVALTAGGTEACNLAVLGALAIQPGSHAVTTSIEHPAVVAPLRSLEARHGLRISWLGVPAGRPPSPHVLAAAITPDTRLVAVQWVNHETGTLLPVAAYAAVCRAANVLCFVDATQALGKVAVDVVGLGADLVALASHKIGGAAGAGALWIRRGVELESLSLGGSQERGRRAGSPDVLAQVGFGAACALLPERLAAQPRIAALRDQLEAKLLDLGALRNASEGPRVGTAINLWFPGRRADALVGALDVEGLAVSAGAACSSGKSEPSPVILAMHSVEPERASSSLRFSFGPQTTESDADFAADACARVCARPAA
jgi:cysteine desulfurase